MKVRSIALGPQWVEYADARFMIEPVTTADDLTIVRLMGEIGAREAGHVHMLPADVRAEMLDLVKRKVVGWEGVVDDRGVAIAYQPDVIEKCFAAGQIYGLFFKIYLSANLSETDRKNSSTPPPSPAAAVSSTAGSAG